MIYLQKRNILSAKPILKKEVDHMSDYPETLANAIQAMEYAWEQIDKGVSYLNWHLDFCNLLSAIKSAEENGVITSEQAQALQSKYLRIVKDPNWVEHYTKV